MKPQLPLWEELPRDKREHGVAVKLNPSLGGANQDPENGLVEKADKAYGNGF